MSYFWLIGDDSVKAAVDSIDVVDACSSWAPLHPLIDDVKASHDKGLHHSRRTAKYTTRGGSMAE
eukprot:scaffold2236_cov152-Skeletonema_menzelii.AAC.23